MHATLLKLLLAAVYWAVFEAGVTEATSRSQFGDE